MRGHRKDYNRWKAGRYPFVSSFPLLEQPGHSIILVENYPCNSKDELRAQEQYHIGLLGDNCTNKQKASTGIPAGLTRKEYDGEYNGLRKEKHICECGG